jgi:hypothetical protein
MSFFQKPKGPLPPGYPLPAIDSLGVPIVVGALVTINTIPESLTHDLPDDEAGRLKARQGTQMRVVEIDSYGHLWFGDCGPWFSLSPTHVTVAGRRE